MKTTTLLVATPILLAFAQLKSDQSGVNRLAFAAMNRPTLDVMANTVTDSLGKTSYEENCRKCHGATGVPSKAMMTKFPKIAAFDAPFLAKRSDDSVLSVLTKGGSTKDMKSFKEKLTHEQMKAVAVYIRSFAK
jgi:mono/diheme cytochrome c family protein